MYVGMPYFLFMEAMVSWLITGENSSYVWNACCLLHFTVLWARVMMGNVCPSFARNPMMRLCFICFSLCFAIHVMDSINVTVSCMVIREPMSFSSRDIGIDWAWCHASIAERIVRVCMGYKSIVGVGMQRHLR